MSRHPLRFSVGDLRRYTAVRDDFERFVEIEGLALPTCGVTADPAIEVYVTLESVADGVTASGTVRTRWRGECRRCLDPAEGTVDEPFWELFSDHPIEGETWPLRGDQLDLEPVVCETVLLALPTAPVCRDDCAGLCAECGADRNGAGCGHDTRPVDPRWAALDVLRDPN